ncbi:hypothetical protein BOX15_Mlig003173g3, partial [Macrostomum lignano]
LQLIAMQYCYNKGCDQQFDPTKNSDNACVFHPGAPVFHDGGKKWSCCNKSSVDFTTFLQIKGCSKGPHNPVKPPPPPKPERSAEIYNEPVLVRRPAEAASNGEAASRPPVDEEKLPLNKQVDSRLLAELDKTAERRRAEAEKAAASGSAQQPDSAASASSDNGSVAMGTGCKNSGCRATYSGPQSDRQVCYYHPGGPVFHEGMKYWSCCQRKTTEFDNFMSQEGCEQGKHCWTKPNSKGDDSKDGPASVHCRCDHHQGKAGYITLDVFAKLCVPEECVIEANRVCCSVKLVFAAGQSRFQRDFVLYDVIDPSQSCVNIRPTKVEILLKKVNAANWPSLELV